MRALPMLMRSMKVMMEMTQSQGTSFMSAGKSELLRVVATHFTNEGLLAFLVDGPFCLGIDSLEREFLN